MYQLFSSEEIKILMLMFDAQKIELNLSFAFAKSQKDFPFLLLRLSFFIVGKNENKT